MDDADGMNVKGIKDGARVTWAASNTIVMHILVNVNPLQCGHGALVINAESIDNSWNKKNNAFTSDCSPCKDRTVSASSALFNMVLFTTMERYRMGLF